MYFAGWKIEGSGLYDDTVYGGCDAGLGLAGLLALVPLFRKKQK